MTRAYEAALGDIAEGDDLTDLLPARDIRHKLAAGVIAAAQDGIVDREQLKRAGLVALGTVRPAPDRS